MMGTLFRLFFLAAALLVVSWVGLFLVPSQAVCFRGLDDAWFLRAFPEDAHYRGAGVPGIPRVSVFLNPFMSEGQGTLIQGWVLIQRHLRVAGGFGPFFAVFSLGSILAGLILRERLRLGSAYASPTSGFLAKRLVEGLSLAFILWVFAPIPAPYWAFYPIVLLGSMGLAAYVANLPLRL